MFSIVVIRTHNIPANKMICLHDILYGKIFSSGILESMIGRQHFVHVKFVLVRAGELIYE